MLRGLSRVKEMQNELVHTKTIIDNLTAENRILKVMERRQATALAKYEESHAELPTVIRSCGEELMSIQTRLRRSKVAFRQLDNKYKMQTKELLAVQKKYKHLLDLTKNKQLGEREKLSTQLEQAENTMKQQEKKIQGLIKTIEVEKRSFNHQLYMENSKVKALQAELTVTKELNDRLQAVTEKVRFQGYTGRKSYASPSSMDAAEPKVPSKNSLSGGDRPPSLDARRCKLTKPVLVHGESELSDHTKDLQKNLMKQVHEDVIHQPKMLVAKKDNSSDSSIATSHLSYGLSDLIKKKDLSDTWSDSSAAQDTDDPVTATNPFSLPNKYGLSTIGNRGQTSSADNQVAIPGYSRGLKVADKTSKHDNSGPHDEYDGEDFCGSISDGDGRVDNDSIVTYSEND